MIVTVGARARDFGGAGTPSPELVAKANGAAAAIARAVEPELGSIVTG